MIFRKGFLEGLEEKTRDKILNEASIVIFNRTYPSLTDNDKKMIYEILVYKKVEVWKWNLQQKY